MTITADELEKLEQLAYLETTPELYTQLVRDLNNIIEMVDELRAYDTSGVKPLFHPLEHHPSLRADDINSLDSRQQLAESAPLFEDGFYLVPKMINGES